MLKSLFNIDDFTLLVDVLIKINRLKSRGFPVTNEKCYLEGFLGVQ